MSGHFFKVVLLLLIIAGSLEAQTETGETPPHRDPQETRELREQYRSEAAWEKVVNFPLRLVFLPVKLVMQGAAYTTGYVYEHKIYQKFGKTISWDNYQQGIRPTYNARTGKDYLYQGLGLKYYHKNVFNEGSRLYLIATIDPVDHDWFEAHLKDLSLKNSKFTADLSMGTIDMEDESFHGFGMDTAEAVEVDYENQVFWTRLGLEFHPVPYAQIGIGGGYEHNELGNIEEDRAGLSPEQQLLFDYIESVSGKYNLWSARVELAYDRPHRKHALARNYVLIRGEIFQDADDDLYGFSKLTVDLIQDIHLFNDRVLSLRMASITTASLVDREIPLPDMAHLGRWEAMRGFSRGRFIGPDLLLGSMEYRYPIIPYGAEFMLFSDTGLISDEMFTKFHWSDVETTFGVGFRTYNRHGEGIRLEAAKSSDGWQVKLGVNRRL